MSGQSDERVAAARADTVALIESLARRLDGIIDASAFTTNDDEHDPEGVTIAFERAQVASLLAQARADLVALDAASARIAAGGYGRCERCGGPIAPTRLESLPAATTCIACAD